MIFYRLYVATATYKLILNTLGMLQASCRHAAGKAEIQPLVWNQISAIGKCQENISNHQHFILYEFDQKLKLFWKNNAKIKDIRKKLYFIISQFCIEFWCSRNKLFNIYTSYIRIHCIVFAEQF